MSVKKWAVRESDKTVASGIAERFGIDPFAALLMASRGIREDEDVAGFLRDDDICAKIADPFTLADMQKAVTRIERALDGNECVAVYGDYDADGVTAAALLYSYLESQGANVIYYIPEREGEGYGLNCAAIDRLKQAGVRLIITVDNGVSALKEAEYARGLGLDLIITDHHMPKNRLPDAVAVIDPHRADCPSGFKDLSGAGVAFKLAMALEGGEAEALLDEYADLVATGTIGDVVPLRGENRAFVTAGVRAMANSRRPGIISLKNAAGAGADRELSSISVAFTLVPRINSVGRMGAADRAVRLLLTDDGEEADEIAAFVERLNQKRQNTEKLILDDINKNIGENPARLLDRVLIFVGESWHQGVLGIVAARLVEKYGKPVIVLARDEAEPENIRGSGRSIEGFSLFDALSNLDEYFIRYGGHDLAAGMTLKYDAADEFRVAINRYAAKEYPSMPFAQVKIDCKLNPAYLNLETIESAAFLEPFGAGNPQPLFGLFGMRLDEITPVGGGGHLRLTLSKNNESVTAMRFGVSAAEFPYVPGDTVDLAVRAEKNEYKGRLSLTIQIKEMRFAGRDEDKLCEGERLFERCMRGEPLSDGEIKSIIPSRDVFALIYRCLKARGGWRHNADILYHRLNAPNISYASLLFTLEVMKELGLISVGEHIKMPVEQNKVNLESSALLASLKERSARRA